MLEQADWITETEAAFIERQRIALLATANPRAKPHAMPVCYVWLRGDFYIPIDEKPKRTLDLRRVRNIRSNPAVTLLFNRYSEDWDELAWVLIEGQAEMLEADAAAGKVLKELRQKYPRYREMALEGRPLIRVRPQKASSWGQLAEVPSAEEWT
ncbi:MAG TPA: TIGR03668 family PPOX class F420-dependent oxidoreductase [Dehalococcoidia bacterium]|nr:TIGR03668 family PPOX class F420-dependent oxidoreductase [Dehalococcoidia bacterium]